MPDAIQKADVLRERSKYREALALYKKALSSLKGKERLDCLMSLGDTCRMCGEFTSAVEYYSEAVSLAGRLKEPLLKIDASVGLGLSERGLGNHKAALRQFEIAERFYRKAEDGEGIAFTLWAKAGALRIKGDVPEAIKTFKAALKLFASLKNEPGVGYCLCGLGGTSRVLGAFPRSLEYYQAANKLFKKRRETFGTAYSHCGMGNAVRMIGQYKVALVHFKKATSLYKRIGDIVSYSYTLWSVGKTYMMLGSYGPAERYLKESLKNFGKTKDPRGRIYANLALAEIKYLKGNKRAARTMALAQLKAADELGFSVERCHAASILSIMDGKADNSCYKKLGLKLRYNSIPLNIP